MFQMQLPAPIQQATAELDAGLKPDGYLLQSNSELTFEKGLQLILMKLSASRKVASLEVEPN